MPNRRILPAAVPLLAALLGSACVQAPVDTGAWPNSLPPFSHYQEVYAQDPDNQEIQSKDEYLNWVIRFYQGSTLYPDGWHSISRDILENVDDPAKKKRVERKLAALGKRISAEWAKDADSRVIRSRELSIWGQAILKSVNNDEEEKLIDQVSADVEALFAGRLDPVDINLKRYHENTAELYGPD